MRLQLSLIMLLLAFLPAVTSLVVTSQPADLFSGCITLCAELGQRPACITTSAENDTAVAALGSTPAFVGNVLTSAGGAAICPDGASNDFSPSWASEIGIFGQPDDLRWAGGAVGVLEGCALLSTAGWEDVPCSRRSAPCLCEPGTTVAQIYNETIAIRVSEEELAFEEDGGRQGAAWGALFGIAIGVEWLFRIFLICRLIAKGTMNQMAAHKAKSEQAAKDQAAAVPMAVVVKVEQPNADAGSGWFGSSPPATAAAQESTEVDDEIALQAAKKLDEAKDAAVRVRKAVMYVGYLTGFISLCILFPLFFLSLAMLWPCAPAGIAFTLLVTVTAAIGQDPTEPRRVRFNLGGQVIGMMPILAGGFAGGTFGYLGLTPYLGTFCSTRDPRCKEMANLAMLLVGPFILIFWYNAIRLLPTLYASRERAFPHPNIIKAEQKKLLAESKGSHNCLQRNEDSYLLEGVNFYDMPAKVALDRWYGTMRIFGFLIGLAWTAIGLFLYFGPLPVPIHMSLGGLLPMGIVMMIVMPSALSPPARRAFVAWLGRLGSAAEERKAAAVAAFMGEIGPEKALDLGKKSFVGLKWKSFTQDDLSNTDLAAKTGLRNRTIKLRLGACDAFLSHSWHDALEPKWEKLDEWAAAFEAEEKRVPVLWLDKACIDQQNIDASLACLPVYLAGCQKLLVLAGPTYVQRLWCICEVFTFVQMGSELSRVQVVPVNKGDEAFNNFSVAECNCFKIDDKAKLMTAIESAFGSHTAFDVVMRTLLVTMSAAKTGSGENKVEVSELLRRGTSKFGSSDVIQRM